MSRANIQRFHEMFMTEQKKLRAGPAKQRTCKDICCLILFLFLVLSFIAIGLYYIISFATRALSPNYQGYSYLSQPLTVIKQLLMKYWPIILGMFIFSILLSLLFVCLLRYCTRCMVYGMIITTIIIMLGIIGISIVSQAWGTLIAMGVCLLIFLCLLFCFRGFFEKGIAMLKIAMNFLKDRPSVYLVPVVMFFLGILFLVFWVITLICIQYNASNPENTTSQKQTVFYIFWIFMIIFIAIFFYYAIVFIVSYMCGKWMYGHYNYGCCSGFNQLNKAHIGTITFATFLVSLVKVVQFLGYSSYQREATAGNSCSACCYCILSCCFQQISYIIEVINHNAIIASAFSGRSFIPSAKLALSVIFKDFAQFFVTNALAQLITICGIVFTAGIPTLLGYLLIHAIYPNQVSIYNSYQITMLILFLFLICMYLSFFFITLISTALSSVFFYLCIEKRYQDVGYSILNMPKSITSLPHRRLAYQLVPKSTERLN